jgi:hypothetical protein
MLHLSAPRSAAEANYMLDRDTDKATVREAARFLATGAGLAGRLQPDVRRRIESCPKQRGLSFLDAVRQLLEILL